MNAGEIKIADINTWFALDYHGMIKFGEYETRERRKGRFHLLAEGLKDLDADIIGIQEANKLPQYAKNLAQILAYDTLWKVENSGIKILGRRTDGERFTQKNRSAVRSQHATTR